MLCGILRVHGYPFQVRSDFGVDAWYAGLAAADAPRHYADVGPLAVMSLRQQRTAGIALHVIIILWSEKSRVHVTRDVEQITRGCASPNP